MYDTLGSFSTRILALPKSQSLRTPLAGSRSRFCGLMSRWHIHLGVDVRQRAEELVDVQLDLEDGHDRLELAEVSRGSIDGFRERIRGSSSGRPQPSAGPSVVREAGWEQLTRSPLL